MNPHLTQQLQTGEISKTINPEKQGRHYVNHENYIDGRSYLFDWVDPQELVDKYCGTGNFNITKKGEWDKKEYVSVGKIIGIDIDKDTKLPTPTDRIAIHYSKTGAHIVPVERR
ncbi:MAG: polymorphic toxin type 50 domain-containing protein [Defluviitaleaceae bacterium]|nr:polymorphic toxin type 50 domain-containing protein [Defluviitaleaceae bacterium]